MSLASVLAQLSRGGGLPSRFKPFANQAANEAYLRFAPEWEGLNALRAQSAGSLRQSVGQAQSAGQLTAALANEGLHNFNASTNPLIQRLAAYDQAPANSSSAVVAQNLGLGHDAVSGLLAQTARNAPIVAGQQATKALAEHQADLEKINAQRASLAGQVGAFTQGRLGDLVGDDRKLRHDTNTTSRKIKAQLAETNARLDVTKRGQDLSHADRQASIDARKTAAGGKLPGGVKVNTPQQHGALKDSVGSALAVVQQQKKLGRSRTEIARTLIGGRPAQTITLSPGDPGYDASNPSANKVKVPALPKVGQLALSVALDQAFDSHVSGHNVNELHRRGYSVKTLGFNTTRPKARPKRAPSRKVSVPLGPAGPITS